MYGFPTILHPEPQGMFDDQSAGFGIPRGNEIFYTIKDGNWNDQSIWETVSGRVGKLPGADDDVYVRHSTILNTIGITTVASLHISGILTYGAGVLTLNILGDFNVSGIINFNTNGAARLTLNGRNNYVSKYAGLVGILTYNDNASEVLDIDSTNLILNNSRKTFQNPLMAINNITLSNSYLNISAPEFIINQNLILNSGSYLVIESQNMIVNGVTQVNGSYLYKETLGEIFFHGVLRFTGFNSPNQIFSVSNNNIFLAAGIESSNYTSSIVSNTGDWTFKTNSQYIWRQNSASTVTFGGKIFIDDIFLTVQGRNPPAGQQIIFTKEINGTTENSILFTDLNGFFYQAEKMLMTIGQVDPGVNITYNRPGDQEIKGTAYDILEFGGSGVKKLMGNVTCKSFSLTGSATIDYNGFTLDIIP